MIRQQLAVVRQRDTSRVEIERLNSTHVERYRAIRLLALAESPDAFGSTFAQETVMATEQWLTRLTSGAITLVATERAADVGLVVGKQHHAYPGDAGLYSMWVAPESRSAGVATRLIQAVIDWARNSGFGAVRLEVGDFNTGAQRVYERIGFVRTGAVTSLPEPRTHVTEHERIFVIKTEGL